MTPKVAVEVVSPRKTNWIIVMISFDEIKCKIHLMDHWFFENEPIFVELGFFLDPYLLLFFLSRWWASSPSERVFSRCPSTSERSLVPNQQTHTFPSALSPLPRTSLPGHEGKPWAGPQTRSPTRKSRGSGGTTGDSPGLPRSEKLFDTQLKWGI